MKKKFFWRGILKVEKKFCKVEKSFEMNCTTALMRRSNMCAIAHIALTRKGAPRQSKPGATRSRD
jgi:hypothetical protein